MFCYSNLVRPRTTLLEASGRPSQSVPDLPGFRKPQRYARSSKSSTYMKSHSGSLGKSELAFSSFLALGNVDTCLDMLVNAKRIPEACFFARTYVPSRIDETVKLNPGAEGLAVNQDRLLIEQQRKDHMQQMDRECMEGKVSQLSIKNEDGSRPTQPVNVSPVKKAQVKDMPKASPIKDVYNASPVKDLQLTSPTKDAKVSPVDDVHTPSPVKESTKQAAFKENNFSPVEKKIDSTYNTTSPVKEIPKASPVSQLSPAKDAYHSSPVKESPTPSPSSVGLGPSPLNESPRASPFIHPPSRSANSSPALPANLAPVANYNSTQPPVVEDVFLDAQAPDAGQEHDFNDEIDFDELEELLN